MRGGLAGCGNVCGVGVICRHGLFSRDGQRGVLAGLDQEQLPQSYMRSSVSGFILLPCSDGNMDQLGGFGLSEASGLPRCRDLFGGWPLNFPHYQITICFVF